MFCKTNENSNQKEHNTHNNANIYCVSKNVSPLVYYNFDTRERILIFFGRNVTDKVSNQIMLYYDTSSNVCYCTVWQNGETQKLHNHNHNHNHAA